MCVCVMLMCNCCVGQPTILDFVNCQLCFPLVNLFLHLFVIATLLSAMLQAWPFLWHLDFSERWTGQTKREARIFPAFLLCLGEHHRQCSQPSEFCLLYWPGCWTQVIYFPIIPSAKVSKQLPAVANLFNFFPQVKPEIQRPKQDKKWGKVANVSPHTDLRDQERKDGWLRPRPDRHVISPCRHRVSNSNASDAWRAAGSSHPEPVCLESDSSDPDKLRYREKKHPFWQLFWQGSNSASFPGMFFLSLVSLFSFSH